MYFSLEAEVKKRKETESERESYLLKLSRANLSNRAKILVTSSLKSTSPSSSHRKYALLKSKRTHSLAQQSLLSVCGEGNIVLSTFLTCFELTRGLAYNTPARL